MLVSDVVWVELTLDDVPRTACPQHRLALFERAALLVLYQGPDLFGRELGGLGVAALNDESRLETVELDLVVEALPGQLDEVGAC